MKAPIKYDRKPAFCHHWMARAFLFFEANMLRNLIVAPFYGNCSILHVCLLALLSGCAGNLSDFSREAMEQSDLKNGETHTPLLVNHTPFNAFLLRAEENIPYYSYVAKLSFEFDLLGHVVLADNQESVISAGDSEEIENLQCFETGGRANEITSWFPYTAILVYGGSLKSVTLPSGEKENLRELQPCTDGTFLVQGVEARKVEYSYVPCVGIRRVNQAHRLDHYLATNAVLTLQTEQGAMVSLSLPEPTEPFLFLRYQTGEIIPTPLRPVLVSVDLSEKRLTLQYQSTFAQTPQIRKIEFMAILSEGAPSSEESPERFLERTEALLTDLRDCPEPLIPIESCATPDRRPNKKIFFSSEN